MKITYKTFKALRNTLFILLLPMLTLNATCTKENLSECVTDAKKAYKFGDYKEAINLLKLPCQSKRGATCGLIGAIYRDGKGDVSQDKTKALSYMKIACEGSYPKSCMDMGILYQAESKIDDALKSYAMGCKKNDVGACYNLATIYYFGDGTQKNLKKAKYLYKKACKLGDSKQSCQRYEQLSGIKKESEVEKFLSKCKAKDGVACHNLSALYYSGKGVKQNYKKAIELDTLACIYKYAMGCKNVALSYLKGTHVKKDTKKAMDFFKAAGSLGEGSGFFNAGNMYQYGKGVKKDLKAAKEMYVSGCLKKDMPSCVKLGYFLEKGVTEKPDGKKAAWLYKTACEHKNQKGCSNMAFLYYEGKVVEQDPLKAKIYFEKACTLGDEAGCKYSKAIKVLKNK